MRRRFCSDLSASCRSDWLVGGGVCVAVMADFEKFGDGTLRMMRAETITTKYLSQQSELKVRLAGREGWSGPWTDS